MVKLKWTRSSSGDHTAIRDGHYLKISSMGKGRYRVFINGVRIRNGVRRLNNAIRIAEFAPLPEPVEIST